MTDDTTLPTTGQANGQPITTGQASDGEGTGAVPRKNFFGGEINFNESNESNTFNDFDPFAAETTPLEPESQPEPEEKKAEETHVESNITEPINQMEAEATTEATEEKEEPTETLSFEPEIPTEEETKAVKEIQEEAEEIKEKIKEKTESADAEEAVLTDTDITHGATATDNTIETPSTNNDFVTKFLHVVDTTRKIFSIAEDKQSFTLLGGKSTNTTLEYFVYLVEDEENHIDLFIKKVETNSVTDVETEHLLQWSYTTTTQEVDVLVDEVLLYQLKTDTSPEILSKLDKFGFLFETHYEELNKAYQEKKQAEAKKKQLHDVFRNF